MALKVAMHNWMRPEPIETTIAPDVLETVTRWLTTHV